MYEQTCCFCNKSANVTASGGLDRLMTIDCKRCGLFLITDLVLLVKNSYTSDIQAKVSSFTRAKTLEGKTIAIYNGKPSTQMIFEGYTVPEIVKSFPAMRERIKNVLINLYRMSKGFGAKIEITLDDYPVFYPEFVEGNNLQNMTLMIQHLIDQGYLVGRTSFPSEFYLTIKAWEEVEKSLQESKQEQPVGLTWNQFDRLPSVIADLQKNTDVVKNESRNLTKKYQVFISATYTDLIHEREEVVKGVLDAHHIPAGMEVFSTGKSQKDTIKRWMDQSDIYLLLVGGRYGSIDEDTNHSYTHDEYIYAKEKGMPMVILTLSQKYLDQKIGQMGSEKVMEQSNPQKFQDFKKELSGILSRTINSLGEIKDAVSNEIQKKVNDPTYEWYGKGWIHASEFEK